MAASKTNQVFWMIAGWFLLIVPAYKHWWEPCQSTINPYNRSPRTISRWKTPWPWLTDFLNAKYGNHEDGLGNEALIWTEGESRYDAGDRVGVRVYYRPKDPPALRVWLWSAWRNSTNALSR